MREYMHILYNTANGDKNNKRKGTEWIDSLNNDKIKGGKCKLFQGSFLENILS